MPILAEKISENHVHGRVPSLATGHEIAVWSLNRVKKLSPPKRNNLLDGLRGLVGNLQFLTAVDDIGCQSVQADDFLIPGTVTEILRGNFPEGIAMNNGMDPVVFRVDQSALAVKNAIARVGIRALFCVGQNLISTLLGLGISPGLANTV